MQVTGTATITSLGTGFNGCRREVRFSGTPTLVHSANLVLPNAANIAIASGDVATFRCVGAGVWVLVTRAKAELSYTPVNRIGDTMTGPLINDHSLGGNNYLNTTRSGFGFAHYNLGNGNVGLFDSTASANAWNYLTSSGGVHTFRGAGTFTGDHTALRHLSNQADSAWGFLANTTGGSARGGIWCRSDGISLVNAPTFRELILNNSGNLVFSGGAFLLGSGAFGVTKISVGTAAPGALAQGEFYFRY